MIVGCVSLVGCSTYSIQQEDQLRQDYLDASLSGEIGFYQQKEGWLRPPLFMACTTNSCPRDTPLYLTSSNDHKKNIERNKLKKKKQSSDHFCVVSSVDKTHYRSDQSQLTKSINFEKRKTPEKLLIENRSYLCVKSS